MEIGILTFHASHNYGSSLQAYALQKTLEQLGHNVLILNFRPDINKRLYPDPISLNTPRILLTNLLKRPLSTIFKKRKYNRFERFINRTLKVTRELRDEKDIVEYLSSFKIDAIITGSDQIWNPECWDFSMVYLCNFNFNGLRIAYAPSLGPQPQNFNQNTIDGFTRALEKYDIISTRERLGSEFLENLLNKNVETVLDPTLILNASSYKDIIGENCICKEDYLLYYTPRNEEGAFEFAVNFAEKKGLKIVVTQTKAEYKKHYNVISITDCGPNEFLNLVKFANFCIGDSFHLIVFSLIFHRPFYVASIIKDSRMMNLLEKVGLSDRLLYIPCDIPIEQNIDFKKCDSQLDKIRETSISFLRNALRND